MLKYFLVGLTLLLPCMVQAQSEKAKDQNSPEELNVCASRPDPGAAATVPAAPETGKKKPKVNKKAEGNKLLLSRVVCEVELALDTYQQSQEVENDHTLPKLASADFDFKTVVDTKGGVSINLFIFKFGGTYDKQDTNDVDFQYVPKSLLKTALEGGRAKSLQTELIDTIKSAAKAIVEQSKMPSPSKDPLVFKQLTVGISYGVTWDVNGGINAPIHLVTLGASLDRSKNNVQQVKLVFSPPPKKSEEEKKEQ